MSDKRFEASFAQVRNDNDVLQEEPAVARFMDSHERINLLLAYLHGKQQELDGGDYGLTQEGIAFIESELEGKGLEYLEAIRARANVIADNFAACDFTAALFEQSFELKLAITYLERPEVRKRLANSGDLSSQEIQALEVFVREKRYEVREMLIARLSSARSALDQS